MSADDRSDKPLAASASLHRSFEADIEKVVNALCIVLEVLRFQVLDMNLIY